MHPSIELVLVSVDTPWSQEADGDISVRRFDSISQAAQYALWATRPFLLAVDQSSPSGEDWARVAPTLGLTEHDHPTGLDLIHAVRRRHPIGLTLPLCLIASREVLPDEHWVAEEQDSGGLSPTVLLRPEEDASVMAPTLKKLMDTWTVVVQRATKADLHSHEDALDESARELPVALVDDRRDYLKRAVANLSRAFRKRGQPDRFVAPYASMMEASSVLLRGTLAQSPFLLVLDHDMQELVTEDLAQSLSLSEDWIGRPAFGWLLARQLRLNHPLGLALPIAYYSGNAHMHASAWTVHERSQPGLSPTAYWPKTTPIEDVVEALDRQAASTFDLLERAQIGVLVSEVADESRLAWGTDER